MIEVQLLGPPRVVRDGSLVAFETRKAMALLALLALGDRPRTRDSLADLLWPDGEVERARGALRRTLSSLRGAIGSERLEATRDHVRLVRGPGLVVDLDRFRELRAEGEAERAVEAFGGRLMEGFAVRGAPAFGDWLDAEAEALQRQLIATLGVAAAGREATGDLAGATAAIQRQVSLDPLHEPAHQALIRLYAAAGDRAAAVAQYRSCVRMLSGELGVAPLPETTAAYDAATRGTRSDAATVAAPVDPPQTDAEGPAFTGRAAELSALLDAYDDVVDDGRVALVQGEPGIGKTRLVEELVAEVTQAGAVVLAARGYEDEAGLAYGPFVDLLRGRLRQDSSWVEALEDGVRTELARLLPEVSPGRAGAAPASLDQPGAQARFLAAVWEALSEATRSGSRRRGVVVLDDLQWADDATLGLLTYGLRRLSGRPLLVVAVWRTPPDVRVRGLAQAVSRLEHVESVTLGRLGQESVAALVRSMGGSPRAAGVGVDARMLWETTEGVPLLLVELLRSGGGDQLTAAARDLLRARLAPVSEQARQVLSAAAVLGRRFDVDVVRLVSGRTEDETVAAVEEIVAHGLVRQGERDYDFDHELLREIAYDETSLARRRLLHARAAQVLAGPAAVVARHLRLAGREEEAALAFADAARQARRVFANQEAIDHLRSALELGHPQRTQLLTALADLQMVLADYLGARASLETAAAACSPGELAAVEHRLGRLQHRRGDHALAEVHFVAALEALPPTARDSRPRVTADLSLTVHSSGDHERARVLALEAAEQALLAQDPAARIQVDNLLGMIAASEGDSREALGCLERARVLTDRLGDGELQMTVLNNLALVHRDRGELTDALALTTSALELGSAMGDRHREAALHSNLADLLHLSGRADEAMAHLKLSAGIFAEVGVEEPPRPEIWKLVRW